MLTVKLKIIVYEMNSDGLHGVNRNIKGADLCFVYDGCRIHSESS